MKTSNLMGQVTSGHIILRGWLKAIKSHPGDLRGDTQWLFLDGMIVGCINNDETPMFSLEPITRFMLPILNSKTAHGKHEVAGLVLELCGNSGKYQRVGRFTLDGVDMWKYSRRFRYKPTSKTPTDGTASYTAVISELLKGIERSLEDAKSNLNALSHLTTYGPEATPSQPILESKNPQPQILFSNFIFLLESN